MRYLFKIALPSIIIVTIAGIIIMKMPNPNPTVVIAILAIATILIIIRMKKIKKNSKKHIRNFTKSIESNQKSNSKFSKTHSNGSNNKNWQPGEYQAYQNELNWIADRYSRVEALGAHAELSIDIRSNGDGTFSINSSIIRDGHPDSYDFTVDNAADWILNHDIPDQLNSEVDSLNRRYNL